MPLDIMSANKLKTVHNDLQTIVYDLSNIMPIKVITGFRSEKEQNEAYAQKKSKLKWPESKHNSQPSDAVDIAPLEYVSKKGVLRPVETIDWNDIRRMSYMAGRFIEIGRRYNIAIRWGGDWDMDTELKDNSFNDLVHFERVIKSTNLKGASYG